MTDGEAKQATDLLGELDSTATAGDLAERASYSEPQFFRIAKKRLGEGPMAVRRRLLLERAAYRLTRTEQSVTEIAFDAAFGSLEGFSRAFKRAFGLSPSSYRRLRPDEFQFDLSERLHFAPPIDRHRQGTNQMKVPELMTEHHCWLMGRFLEACDSLPAESLDDAMDVAEPFPWCDSTVSLRQMLARGVAFAAPWMHAINGEQSNYEPKTLEEMRAALPVNRDGFMRILKTVDKDNSYDLTFVDAVCEPPEVFSYGGVISHALTFAAYRRMAIVQELRKRGFDVRNGEDPIAYERREL